MVTELAKVFNGGTFDERVFPEGVVPPQETPYVILLTCQVAKVNPTGSAAPGRPSRTLGDPIHFSDLPQGPSPTAMRLVCIKKVQATSLPAASRPYRPLQRPGSHRTRGDRPHGRSTVGPVLAGAALQERPSLRCPDPEALQVRRQARL